MGLLLYSSTFFYPEKISVNYFHPFFSNLYFVIYSLHVTYSYTTPIHILFTHINPKFRQPLIFPNMELMRVTMELDKLPDPFTLTFSSTNHPIPLPQQFMTLCKPDDSVEAMREMIFRMAAFQPLHGDLKYVKPATKEKKCEARYPKIHRAWQPGIEEKGLVREYGYFKD